MQTMEPTQADVNRWRETFAACRGRLRPNRKSGAELAAYLERTYPVEPVDDARYRAVVTGNIEENAFSRERIPPGAVLDPRVYRIARVRAGKKLYAVRDGNARDAALYGGMDIMVGIECVTGEFYVEGSSDLWELLFAFRGLDAQDLENPYLVSEYVHCLKRFGRLAEGADGTLIPAAAPGTR